MKLLWLTSLVVLFSLPLHTETKDTPDTSGNAFVRLCSNMDAANQWAGACLGYAVGTVDGLNFETAYAQDKAGNKAVPSLFRIPESVENGQIIRVLLKHINDNPKDAHLPTVVLIVDALQEAFPCKSN